MLCFQIISINAVLWLLISSIISRKTPFNFLDLSLEALSARLSTLSSSPPQWHAKYILELLPFLPFLFSYLLNPISNKNVLPSLFPPIWKSWCGEPLNFNDPLFLELDSTLLCLSNIMQGKQNKVFCLQLINQFQFFRFPLEIFLEIQQVPKLARVGRRVYFIL